MPQQIVCDLCRKEIPMKHSTYLIEVRRKPSQYDAKYTTRYNTNMNVCGLEICEDCKTRIFEFLHITFYNPKLFKTKRTLLGLSQQQLAKESNLSQATISAVENGFSCTAPVTITHIGNTLNAIAEKQDMLERFYKLEADAEKGVECLSNG